MAGHKAVVCGRTLTEARCTQCRTVGTPPGACGKCDAQLPVTCARRVPPGQCCPDHPEEVKPERWEKTPGEQAQLARLKGMKASEKAQELADALTARALESGNPLHLEAATRAMALALRAREIE